jgi:molybdopterin converting factor small subunit
MEVTIKLYNEMKRFAPVDKAEFTLTLKSGSTAASALEFLNIPEDVPFTLLVNGRRADANTSLENGSIIVLFPPVSGG